MSGYSFNTPPCLACIGMDKLGYITMKGVLKLMRKWYSLLNHRHCFRTETFYILCGLSIFAPFLCSLLMHILVMSKHIYVNSYVEYQSISYSEFDFMFVACMLASVLRTMMKQFNTGRDRQIWSKHWKDNQWVWTHWTIPEITCTPPKEDMGIPKILTTFFIGKSPKNKHFFGCKGKKDMRISKVFNHFSYKNGNSQFFYYLWHKKLGIPIF